MSREGELLMEDARIVFRNFAGREGKYNAEGDRNFCVLLDEKLASEMERDGWNVKALKSREPDDPPQPYMQVSVGFKFKPPVLVAITSQGRTVLSEGEVELFDWFDIDKVDLNIRSYRWNVGGRTGLKAYLKSLYVTVAEDPLKLKYQHIPEIGASPVKAIEGQMPEAAFDWDRDIVEGEVVEEQLAITDGNQNA